MIEDLSWRSVKVAGQQVDRPTSIPPSEWLEFWDTVLRNAELINEVAEPLTGEQ